MNAFFHNVFFLIFNFKKIFLFVFFIVCIFSLYLCNVKEGKGNNFLLPFSLTWWVFIFFGSFLSLFFWYFFPFSFIFQLLILIIKLLITWHVCVMCMIRIPLAQKKITHCNIVLFIFHIFYMVERGGKNVSCFFLIKFFNCLDNVYLISIT